MASKISLKQILQSGASVQDVIVWNGTNYAPATLSLGVSDGDKGDITVSGSGATWTVDPNAITLAKLAQVSTSTFLGRTTAATGNVETLTVTQATALLDPFTTSLKGLVPASGGGTTNFLRADGTWAAPAGGGGGIGSVEPSWVATAVSTGSSQVITLPFSGIVEANVIVTIEGLLQDPTDYTISGTDLTLTAPDSGLSIVVRNIAARAPLVLPSEISATTYTLAITDSDSYLRATNASGCSITIPPNSSAAFAIGSVVTCRRAAAGVVTLVAGAGVTLNQPGGPTAPLTLSEIGATVQLKKIALDEWDIIGGTG